ncbi:DUF3540 domain-containing protein [Paraburkholderia sp. D15]|uniref:DUF3540 domain-containing protein n=1 Tax=Paraburkholderia sp. D15 TaxID=2880218 RepID=UPI002478E661|nr:DUF3540 domain-containing protein [Paraburkholderia sp. D15]WGS49451.1 DUF3540 domain-containing protein [Paraburkholderia sp. D15]
MTSTSTVAELRTLPSSLSPAPAADTAGTVLALLHDGLLLVDCADARLPCRRAFSCLIAPEIGDRVVVSHAEPQRPHVIAILDRPHPHAARIHIDGDLLIESSNDVRIRATHAVHLQADDAALVARKTSLHCTEFEGYAGSLRVIGKTLESVFERVVQIAKASFRSVESLDHHRCAQLDYAASESVRLHGKHTLLTAERLAKLDAQQIHLG